MILRNASYLELSEKIKKEKRNVIVYGAGAVGKIVVPYFLQKYQLEPYVRCYVDQDTWKTGQSIQAGSHCFEIRSLEELKKTDQDVVILITNSNLHPVIKALDEIPELDSNEAYVIPMIQMEETEPGRGSDVIPVKQSDKPLIPRVIHYTWFSGEPIPEHLKKCIDSWGKYAPDYEIKQWNAGNYDIGKNKYMRQAYEHKKWGYIADVARLDILYQYGGIYMDTDVELIRNPDKLLYQIGFCGFEKWGVINMGGCSGAVPGNQAVKMMLDYRQDESFVREDGSLNKEPSGAYETHPLVTLGLKINNQTQVVGDMTVYASDYFHPYDYMSGVTRLTPNTVSIHYFHGAWLDESIRSQRKKATDQYFQVLERMKN